MIRFDNALRSDDVAIAVRDNRNKFPTPFAANARSACGFHQHSDWRLNQPAFFIDVSLFRSCSLLPFLPVRLSLCTCVVSRVQPCVQHLLGSGRDRESSIYERARVHSSRDFCVEIPWILANMLVTRWWSTTRNVIRNIIFLFFSWRDMEPVNHARSILHSSAVTKSTRSHCGFYQTRKAVSYSPSVLFASNRSGKWGALCLGALHRSLSSHIVFPSVSIPLVLSERVSSRSTPLRFSRCDCSHVAPFVSSVSSRSPKYSLQVLHVPAASDWQNSRDEYLRRMDEFVTFPSSHQISPIPNCCSYR